MCIDEEGYMADKNHMSNNEKYKKPFHRFFDKRALRFTILVSVKHIIRIFWNQVPKLLH